MNKHAPMIIFMILIIIVIGYALYCYFALRNGYFPFQFYVVNPSDLPPDAVQPNGNVSFNPFNKKAYLNGVEDLDLQYSPSELENIKDAATNAQETYCNWYCSWGSKAFPLPKGQSPVGYKQCVCKK